MNEKWGGTGEEGNIGDGQAQHGGGGASSVSYRRNFLVLCQQQKMCSFSTKFENNKVTFGGQSIRGCNKIEHIKYIEKNHEDYEVMRSYVPLIRTKLNNRNQAARL